MVAGLDCAGAITPLSVATPDRQQTSPSPEKDHIFADRTRTVPRDAIRVQDRHRDPRFAKHLFRRDSGPRREDRNPSRGPHLKTYVREGRAALGGRVEEDEVMAKNFHRESRGDH
jgi:hypothetical protein